MVLTEKLQYVFSSSFWKVSRNKRRIPNIAVGKSFRSRYPKATFARWNKVDVLLWEVNFRIRGKDFSALFDNDGNWLETVTAVSLSYTPKRVQESFSENHAPEGLQQIHHIQTSNSDIFEIEWGNGVFAWKLLYDFSGKLMGKLIV